MKSTSLKVLSIDFDYFQKVSKETVMECYPDGIDLPPAITEITWTGHYAFDGDRLNEVKINSKEIELLGDVLLKQKKNAPVLVSHTHKDIYDFILSYLGKDQKLYITNIDMHHDMFNNNKELDCGNWVNKIIRKHPNTKLTWVANPISKSVYGIEDLPIEESIASILDQKFDIIFLCRSDTWLPPHLDVYFSLLIDLMRQYFDKITITKSVLEPRDIVRIQNEAKERKEMMENIMKDMKGGHEK